MKALLLSVDFPPDSGGRQRYLFNLYNNFPKSEFVVVVPKVEGYKEVDALHDIKVYREDFFFPAQKILPSQISNFTRLMKCVRILLTIIKKEKIEIIHIGHAFPLGISASLLIHKLTGIDYILYAHASEISTEINENKKGRVMQAFLGNAKKIVAVSKYTKEMLVKNGVKEQDIIVINPGINATSENRNVNSSNNSDKKVLLTISRLVKRKGHDFVIKSIPLIIKEVPDFVYKIVGTGTEEQELKKIAADMEVEEYVEFIDHIADSELAGYYEECDVFILNSRELENGDAEGFGIVFLEANYYGKPVIGGKSGGISDAVEDNVSGLLVHPTDVREIADSVILLMKNPEYAQKLGRQGKERATKLFNWNHISDEAYKKLANL